MRYLGVLLACFCSLASAQAQHNEATFSPAELRTALEACRNENERLRKLVPDSLAYPQKTKQKPIPLRINNITYSIDRKQYSMYQVISDLPQTRIREKVVRFLQSRGHAPQGDTLLVNDLLLTELHPTRIQTSWVIENYEGVLSVLKVWILLPGGAYLNPENYPGYHEKISRLLTYILNDQP